MKSENPIQLNLNFIVKKPLFDISATLEGIFVSIVSDKENLIECKNYILSLGIIVLRETPYNIVVDLKSFLATNNKSNIVIKGDLKVLKEIYDNNKGDLEYVVRYENSEFNVSWKSGKIAFNERISTDSMPAFLRLEFNFTADTLTWGEVNRSVYAPINIGVAKISFDGYIEINTNLPQLLETSGITSLFKISEYNYGCPLSSINELQSKSISLEEINSDSELLSKININESEIINKLSSAKIVAFDKIEELSKYSFSEHILSNVKHNYAVIVANSYNYVGWRLFQNNTKQKLFVLNYENKITDKIASDTDLVIFDVEIDNEIDFLNLKHFDSIYSIFKVLLLKYSDYTTDQRLDLFNCIKPSEFKSSKSIFSRYPKSTYISAENHMSSYLVNYIEKSKIDFDVNIIVCKPDLEHKNHIDNLLYADRVDLARVSLSAGFDKTLGCKISKIVELLSKDHSNIFNKILILSNYTDAVSSLKIILGKNRENVEIETYDNFDGDLQGIDKIYLIDLPLEISKKNKKIIRFKKLNIFFIDHKLEKDLISNFFNDI